MLMTMTSAAPAAIAFPVLGDFTIVGLSRVPRSHPAPATSAGSGYTLHSKHHCNNQSVSVPTDTNHTKPELNLTTLLNVKAFYPDRIFKF